MIIQLLIVRPTPAVDEVYYIIYTFLVTQDLYRPR